MNPEPIFGLNFSGIAVVTDDGRSLSYAELKRATEEWEPQLPRRSLVFLLVENNLESLVAYVACLNRGIVPLMLSAQIDQEHLQRFVNAYKPVYVYNLANGSGSFLNADSPLLHDELALLITTSGSTGSPKLVRQSYKNIAANAASIIEYLELDETERPITTLPMNYVYGLSIINTHLKVGATLLLTKRGIMEREFWNFFDDQQATSFGGVPYTYEMLDRLMFFRRRLPSLRTMTQAGGKITPELHRKFAEYAAKEGKKFVVMYGAAEATSRMAYLPPERALEKVGSMGIPIPGGRFEIEEGELVYFGENVTLGYAESACDLAKGDERRGCLFTGDMARVDDDGYYYVIGRKKRFLKIFGNRISLDETERLIKGKFSGIDCACVGSDDHMKIYIAGTALPSEIRKFVAEKTNLNLAAFDVASIENIPKNDSGKTLYAELG